jgi:Bardet-Biedl syndrome 2 protein
MTAGAVDHPFACWVDCRDLTTDQLRRSANQLQLLEALREVNQMIQRAAKLRVGAAKGGVVAACRAAIKASNLAALLGIIRNGA